MHTNNSLKKYTVVLFTRWWNNVSFVLQQQFFQRWNQTDELLPWKQLFGVCLCGLRPPPKTLQVSIQNGPAPLYTFTVQLFTPHRGSFSGFFHEPKQTWAALTASASLKPRRNKSLCFVFFWFFSKILMLLTVPLNHRLKCLPSSHYLPLFFLCLLLSVTLLEPAAHRQHVFLSSAVFKKLISSVIVSQRSTWKWLAPSQALAHGNIRILKSTHARTERERRIHQKSATAAHLHHGFLNDSPSCVCVCARVRTLLCWMERAAVLKQRDDEAPSVLDAALHLAQCVSSQRQRQRRAHHRAEDGT